MLFPEFGRIGAVIVTYNIGRAFIKNFQTLIGQVDYVFVIDNGSTDDTLAVLEEVRAAHPDFMEIIKNGVNNLANAQNLGIRLAESRGMQWVMLLDHDSALGENTVRIMQQAWQDTPGKDRIGVVAPHVYDKAAGRHFHYIQPHRFGLAFRRAKYGAAPVIDSVLAVIASGSLMPIWLFKEVGLMDEALVIDYVDTDFCLRLSTRGYRIIVVRDAMLYHHLGESCGHQVMGMKVTATNHSPLRRYYIYRNRLKTWQRYSSLAPSYITYDVLAAGYDVMRILFFEKDKGKKIEGILKGAFDALCGIEGPMEEVMEPALNANSGKVFS